MNATASSQIFSAARFGATLRRDWRMERSQWAWRIVAMAGVIGALMFFITAITNDVVALDGEPVMKNLGFERVSLGFLCFFMLFIFLCLGASLFYHGYSTPGQRLNQLMNPASTLEKFASRFVICIIGVPVAFALCWEVCDLLRVWLGDMFYHRGVAAHVNVFDALGIVKLKVGTTLFSPYMMLSWQAIYALGSTLWPKNSFLKTIGAMCVLEFVYGFVGGWSFSLFADFQNISVGADTSVNLIENMSIFGIISNIAVILFCFITAYFRMREEEIIQRM